MNPLGIIVAAAGPLVKQIKTGFFLVFFVPSGDASMGVGSVGMSVARGYQQGHRY